MQYVEMPNAIEAAGRIAAGTLSPVELIDACLGRIEARDGEIAAWSYVDEQGARTTAHEREAEARSKRLRGPLHGVPWRSRTSSTSPA